MEIKFKKVHTGKDLILSALVLAAGIGLYFIHAGLGFLIAGCGILLLLFFKAGHKRVGADGPVLTKKAFDVAHSCRQNLKDFLDGKDVEPDVSAPGAGGVVRLEVYYNREAEVAYAQLFDFSSYTYEAATGVVELTGPRAVKLISKL